MKRIAIEADRTAYALLEVLTRGAWAPRSVEDVVSALIDHAQQGVYRPGAWEREWLVQVFGLGWTAHLEPGDPYGRPDCEAVFERPKRPRRGRRPV
jgi:hypothetical protein